MPAGDQNLKAGVTLSRLQELSKELSDNGAASRLSAARTELFQSIQRPPIRLILTATTDRFRLKPVLEKTIYYRGRSTLSTT